MYPASAIGPPKPIAPRRRKYNVNSVSEGDEVMLRILQLYT